MIGSIALVLICVPCILLHKIYISCLKVKADLAALLGLQKPTSSRALKP